MRVGQARDTRAAWGIKGTMGRKAGKGKAQMVGVGKVPGRSKQGGGRGMCRQRYKQVTKAATVNNRTAGGAQEGRTTTKWAHKARQVPTIHLEPRQGCR